jgi:ParB-like chromosome segregation protein Spo0J
MIRREIANIANLKPDENNPRKISKSAMKALRSSIRRFGLVQPVIVNERTGRVVGGHQRLEALKAEGITDVDVVIGEWSEAEERALNVSLNNPGAQGSFTNVAEYLSSVPDLGLAAMKSLNLDTLVFGKSEKEEDFEARGLEYRLIITCNDESHQMDLLEQFEASGLSVKVVIQ